MADVATKHTPEPWKCLEGFDGLGRSWCGIWPQHSDFGDDGCIAEVYDKTHGDRLVACHNRCAGINPESVPKMLELLRGVVADYDYHAVNGSTVMDVDTVASFREAIALAEKQT